MKRFFSVLCLLLLIFVFISCDNFSLIGKHSAKGTVYIQIPDSHAGRSVTLQTQEDVKDYNIFIYNNKTDSLVYEKEFSPGEMNSGIAIELNHGDYLINVVAYDSNGELFSGTNSEPVHVTSENTPENPAVVTINMKYVLVVYDNGPEASSRCRHFETLEEDTVPSRLKPDPSFLPRKFFIRGREIISWTDMDTSENYGVGEEIPLDDKTLPLHLTANWSEPTGPAGGTVTYTLYSNQKEGDEGRSIKTAEKGSTVFLSRPWDGEYTCETSSYTWYDSSHNYYVFCGWSTKQVPVLTSETYNKCKEELKNAKVVNWGEGYYLTEDTSFYAVWMATDIYDEKTLPVGCTLGKDEHNEAANVRLYYLKDLFTTEEVDEWPVYKFTLPDIPTLFPQWDTAPALAIKDEYWVINNDYENASGNFAGHVADIRTTNEDITLKTGIKVPLIEYYDGGLYYNSGEYNAEVITGFYTDFEEAIYAMTWPLPSSHSIKLWQPIDQNYAETPFASSVYYAGNSDYWRFDRWVYMDSDENVLVDQDGWFSTYGISTDSFPLQLSARWKAPVHDEATPIRTKDDLMKISSNGIYSLENNLRLESYDLLRPLVEEFNGTFYGNGMTIAIIGSAVPLFDTIGTDGTITELNISGNLDDYSSYKSFRSMLCYENKGEVSCCKYRSYDSIPQVDCIFGGYTSGNASNYQNLSVQKWDNDKGWVNWDVSTVLTKEITTTPQGGGQQVVSYPDTGYDASDFANTKYYQCSDVQWNYPLAEGKALGITVTGNVTGDVTCTGTEFLKLQNIQVGSSITADIYLYTSEDDTEGTLKGTYTIDAVTKYGIKTGTPFLFTGEGLNHYNSRTENDASGKRMDSEMIICNPTNIDAVQTAIMQYLGGGQQGGNTLGITMVNVPSGTVNVSIDSVDSAFYSASSASITLNAFQIAETEVTYAQWCEVYDWAENNGYSFPQTGQPGNGGEGQSLTEANGSQPATNMSWRDVIVWCNAASEYEGLDPVYYYFESGTGDFLSSNVIREAETSSVKSAGQGKADNITVNPNANGYRLPTEAEWEYAARGGNPDADTWNYTYAGSNTCSEVANKSGSTTAVGSLTGNLLGLFDMCGNAGEFVWKKNSSKPNWRYYRGGSCNSPYESNCTITSYSYVDYQTSKNTDLGFRVVSGGAGNFGNL